MKKRKVVDIQVQKRRKNRRNIYLDDGSVFGVSEDVFISIPIHIGDTISDQVFNDILESDSKSKIYNSAISLLSYRMRSKSELKDRLIRKNYNEDGIMNVINNLELKGYLDDEKFAYAFAKEKVKNKLIGPIALKFEMSSHKLDLELIDRTINSIYDMFPQKMIINRLITKWKVKDSIGKDPKIKSKIINRLKNKGFYWDDIQSAINAFDYN
ncbi:MAG: regulatory protein RecX [Candidatus Neomarinimicrobiota bacterium]|nr:regulatory protein RecX [Candidatus Neomarinimicrobiota bacterium]